jgi:hypothetical protein
MALFEGEVQNPLANFGWGDVFGDGGAGPLDLFSNVLRLLVVVAGLFTLVNLLIAGIQYIGSSGDPKLMESAWKRIYLSFLGLILIIGSFTLAYIIGAILGIDIFNPQIYAPGDAAL